MPSYDFTAEAKSKDTKNMLILRAVLIVDVIICYCVRRMPAFDSKNDKAIQTTMTPFDTSARMTEFELIEQNT